MHPALDSPLERGSAITASAGILRGVCCILLSVISYFSAGVAQLVEQRIENPCVGGSSPPPGTQKITLPNFGSVILNKAVTKL